jgi:hypothetical protein
MFKYVTVSSEEDKASNYTGVSRSSTASTLKGCVNIGRVLSAKMPAACNSDISWLVYLR